MKFLASVPGVTVLSAGDFPEKVSPEQAHPKMPFGHCLVGFLPQGETFLETKKVTRDVFSQSYQPSEALAISNPASQKQLDWEVRNHRLGVERCLSLAPTRKSFFCDI